MLLTVYIVLLQKYTQQNTIVVGVPLTNRRGEGMEDIYEKMIDMIASHPEECVKLIIIEHMTGLEIPEQIGAFSVKKSKKFGNTSLTYLDTE